MLYDVTKKWINEHGEGHWEVTNGIEFESCDDGELSENIRRLSTSAD